MSVHLHLSPSYIFFNYLLFTLNTVARTLFRTYLDHLNAVASVWYTLCASPTLEHMSGALTQTPAEND